MIIVCLILGIGLGLIVRNENKKISLLRSYSKVNNIRVRGKYVLVDNQKFTGKVYSYNVNGMTFVLEVGRWIVRNDLSGTSTDLVIKSTIFLCL